MYLGRIPTLCAGQGWSLLEEPIFRLQNSSLLCCVCLWSWDGARLHLIDKPIPSNTQMKEWGPKRLTNLFVQLRSHKTVEVKPEKTHSPPPSQPCTSQLGTKIQKSQWKNHRKLWSQARPWTVPPLSSSLRVSHTCPSSSEAETQARSFLCQSMAGKGQSQMHRRLTPSSLLKKLEWLYLSRRGRFASSCPQLKLNFPPLRDLTVSG